MAVVKRIRNRGGTFTVEAHAEVLFMPGGSVNNWTNRFTQRIRAKTIAAAPSNKRPRWAHYGRPLKETIFSARPAFWGNGRDKQRVYAAVGSKAPHAGFVDQGTGVFAGNGPYRAEILPPWHEGAPSLYEATWRPGGTASRLVRPVFIKGQKGQFYMDAGLRDAMRSMKLRAAQVPGDPKITDALNSIPSAIENFVSTNTSANPAFKAQLGEWRKWRDEAWKRGEGLGRAGGLTSRAHRQAMQASQNKPRPPKAPTAPASPKNPTKAQIRAKYYKAIQREREALQKQASAQYVGKKVTVGPRTKHDGKYAYPVRLVKNGVTVTVWITSDYQVAL